jgi:ADP-ribose pyrophosphatase
MKAWQRIEPTLISKIGYRTVVSKFFKMPVNGTTKHFETVNPEDSRAAAILAITGENKVIICRQYRPGPGMIMDDIPGGGINEGETLEAGALRELLEETGYEPGALTYLGVMHYDAYDNLARHCFLATGCRLSKKTAQRDAEEFIDLRLVDIDEVIAIAKAGKMTDPGAVLLAYDQLKEMQNGTKSS